MRTLLFPPDTRAPMLAVWRGGWARTWKRTDKGLLVRDGTVSDWEADIWVAALLAVAEEGSDGTDV